MKFSCFVLLGVLTRGCYDIRCFVLLGVLKCGCSVKKLDTLNPDYLIWISSVETLNFLVNTLLWISLLGSDQWEFSHWLCAKFYRLMIGFSLDACNHWNKYYLPAISHLVLIKSSSPWSPNAPHSVLMMTCLGSPWSPSQSSTFSIS